MGELKSEKINTTIEIMKQVVNGTMYHENTPKDLIEILEAIRLNNTRVVLDYGDVETGVSWGEIYDITGTISRSSGPSKIPILIHNKRSMGGCAILDHCIISIATSVGKVPLYNALERLR